MKIRENGVTKVIHKNFWYWKFYLFVSFFNIQLINNNKIFVSKINSCFFSSANGCITIHHCTKIVNLSILCLSIVLYIEFVYMYSKHIEYFPTMLYRYPLNILMFNY